MLNELKSGDPTVKTNLVAALNANFTKILAKFVQENNEVNNKLCRLGNNLKKYSIRILIIMETFL